MTPEERAALRRLYEYRCGYCGVSETDVGAELTIDHFQPRSRGGQDQWDNWVYGCFTCNNHKGDYWQPESVQRILHPLRDYLAEHIAEQSDGTLVGLTETGRFHIERLHLNRPALVAHRLQARRAERNERELAELQRRLVEVDGEVTRLRQRLERM
jgi:hypothetical protein